jgi:putative oxidoreductase
MNRTTTLCARLQSLKPLQHALADIFDLFVRLYVAKVFFWSGFLKLQDWGTTLALFQDEYSVPLLPPDIAAYVGTFGELFFPVLLVLGLATPLGALGMSAVNIMAVVSYWSFLKDAEPALAQHFLWGTMCLMILLHGPGRLSLDALICRKAKA